MTRRPIRDNSDVEFAVEVPSNEVAPEHVRRELRERSSGSLDPSLRHDLELLLTEVVTNAVQHGSDPDDETISVRVRTAGTSASASVTDSGDGFDPRQVGATPHHEPGGFGLLMLDRLSARWGAERSGGGFRVWFQLNARQA